MDLSHPFPYFKHFQTYAPPTHCLMRRNGTSRIEANLKFKLIAVLFWSQDMARHGKPKAVNSKRCHSRQSKREMMGSRRDDDNLDSQDCKAIEATLSRNSPYISTCTRFPHPPAACRKVTSRTAPEDPWHSQVMLPISSPLPDEQAKFIKWGICTTMSLRFVSILSTYSSSNQFMPGWMGCQSSHFVIWSANVER